MPDLKVNVGWNFGTVCAAIAVAFIWFWTLLTSSTIRQQELAIDALTTEVKAVRAWQEKHGPHGQGAAP